MQDVSTEQAYVVDDSAVGLLFSGKHQCKNQINFIFVSGKQFKKILKFQVISTRWTYFKNPLADIENMTSPSIGLFEQYYINLIAESAHFRQVP